jgi:hypothetical protein
VPFVGFEAMPTSLKQEKNRMGKSHTFAELAIFGSMAVKISACFFEPLLLGGYTEYSQVAG